MKLIAVLALVLCLFTVVSAVQGPGADYLPLPWDKFSTMAPDVVDVQQGGCSDQPLYEFTAEKDGKGYTFIYGMKSNRLLVIYYASTKPGTMPSKVAVGVVDPEHADRVPPMRIIDGQQTPCDILRGANAGKPQPNRPAIHRHTI